MFYYLGVTFFAGIAIFVISIIINVWLSRRSARFQKALMAKTDARVTQTAECLNNIKMIKLYAWVDLFSGKIDTKRKEELNKNFWRINNMALMVTSMQFFPQLL